MPTADFSHARDNMVDSQIRTDDVTNPALIAAFRSVPREAFVPPQLQPVAYMGEPVEVAPGRFLLDPRSLAKLCQLAEVRASDAVLDVGGTTGYSAAILSGLAGKVTALESSAGLAAAAKVNLAHAAKPVSVVVGPLAKGWPDGAPYDVILLNGAVPELPEALLDQLAVNGRLVGVVTDRVVGKAHIVIRAATGLSSRIAFDATVPLLAGFESAPHFVF